MRNDRLKAVRGLDPPAHSPGFSGTAAAAFEAESSQMGHEEARVQTGDSFHVLADEQEHQFHLPGAAVYHFATAADGIRRPATMVAEGYREKALYRRPSTALFSEIAGQADREMLRNMVREALKEQSASADKGIPVHGTEEIGKLRAGAALQQDPPSLQRAHLDAKDNRPQSDGALLAGSVDDSRNTEANSRAHQQDGREHFPMPDDSGHFPMLASHDPARDPEAGKDEEAPASQGGNEGAVRGDGATSRDRSRPPRTAEISEQLEEEKSDIPATLRKATDRSCTLFCGGFSRTNPMRRFCFETFTSARFAAFSLTVTVLNSLYIALAPELKGSERRSSHGPDELAGLRETLFYFDIACAVCMGLEVLLGIVAYGCFRTPSTYLRNSGFHQLDAACVIFTVLEYLASSLGLPNFTLRPFRMLRFFKFLCKVEMFSGVKNIIATLKEGLMQLMIIFLFLLLTLAGSL